MAALCFAIVEGTEKADIDKALVSELVGDYLLTDYDFIKQISVENRNVFQRLWDEVKYLCKVASAGSKEARQFERVKRNFEKAYKEASAEKSTADEDGVKYSITSDSQGKYVKVDVNQNIFEGKNIREMQDIARKLIKDNFKGQVLPVGSEGKAYINKRSADEYAYHANRRMNDTIKESKMRASTELDNLLSVSEFVENQPDDGSHPQATGGWDVYTTRFEVANIMFSGEVKIMITDRGYVFYDITQIKRLPVNGGQTKINSVAASGNLSTNSIPNSAENVKQKQLEIINENNPAPNSYNTWIRKVEDIKTLAETLEDSDWSDGDVFNPDLTRAMIEEAIESGEITVYSSYPIEQGVFVSPSYMEAASYSGDGNVYEQTVNINDVAWIDPTQGMYANTGEQYSLTSDNSSADYFVAPMRHEITGKDFRVKGADGTTQSAPTAGQQELAPVGHVPIETKKQKLKVKAEAYQTEIDKNIQLRNETAAYYDEKIINAEKEYNALKNKHSKKADRLQRSIERNKRLKAKTKRASYLVTLNFSSFSLAHLLLLCYNNLIITVR